MNSTTLPSGFVTPSRNLIADGMNEPLAERPDRFIQGTGEDMQTANTRRDVLDYIAVYIVGHGDTPRARHVVMLTEEQFKQQRIHLIGFEGLVKSEDETFRRERRERAALHLQAEKFLDEGRGLTYGTAMLMRLGAPVADDLNNMLSRALTDVLKGTSDEIVGINTRWGKGVNGYHAEVLFEQAVASIEDELGLGRQGKGRGWMFAKKSPAYAAKYLAYHYICQAIHGMYEGDHARQRLAA